MAIPAIENAILGTDIAGEDLYGTELNDSIIALDGDDNIYDDLGGNDYIITGGGLNVVEAGIGEDFVIGGIGDDTVLGEEGDDELYGGDGADLLLGAEGNDIIYGQDGDDVDNLTGGVAGIDGGAGDDILLGEAGADTMAGGFGSDFVSGGADADTLYSHAGQVSNQVVERDEFYLGGGADADTIVLNTRYLGGGSKANSNPKTDLSKAIIFDFNKTADTLDLLGSATSYTYRASGNYFGSRRADTAILSGNNVVAIVVDQSINATNVI